MDCGERDFGLLASWDSRSLVVMICTRQKSSTESIFHRTARLNSFECRQSASRGGSQSGFRYREEIARKTISYRASRLRKHASMQLAIVAVCECGMRLARARPPDAAFRAFRSWASPVQRSTSLIPRSTISPIPLLHSSLRRQSSMETQAPRSTHL